MTNPDVRDRDVQRLLAIARKVARYHPNVCGQCVRDAGGTGTHPAIAGCEHCAARSVLAGIAVRRLARARALNRQRNILRAVGRRIRSSNDEGVERGGDSRDD